MEPIPATLQRSSSEPLFQAHDNQYYPPELTFKAPEPYTYTPHLQLPAETERPTKNPEQDKVLRKMKSLEQSFRSIHGLGSQVSVSYKDLCPLPDVQLPDALHATHKLTEVANLDYLIVCVPSTYLSVLNPLKKIQTRASKVLCLTKGMLGDAGLQPWLK